MNDTESTCEVVRIVAIEVHPNADRLEIARFMFKDGTVPDYQCVVRKGDYTIGEWAVYISDDMLVPVTHPKFEFLKDKAKGGYHRVRACRLRGVMSTGMLVDMKDQILGKLGDDVADKLGVLKYVSPLEQNQNSNGGENIGTVKSGGGVVKRLLQWLGKKLYKPVKIPDYSVLSLRKVPGLFTEGEPVIVTEKIHGSNIRFGKINGRVYIGSLHTEKSDSRPWILRKLSPRKGGSGYYGTDAWSSWFRRVFNSADLLDDLPNNIIFYGELFGPGIQPWTYGLSATTVRVFDAYDVKSRRWLDWLEIQELLPVHVGMVPTVVAHMYYNRDEIKKLAEGKSFITGDGPMEGVVVRSLDWKRAGKLVSDTYLASEH